MDLTNLRSFIRVADLGSYTRAAKALGVPTSTMTRRIQRLEDQLQSSLVARDGRGISLTQDGKRLYRLASEAIYALDGLGEAFNDCTQAPRGLLRLTAPADLGGSRAFARVVAGFRDRYPQINLDIHLSNRLVDLAAEGMDIALRASPKGTPGGAGLMCRRVATSIDGAIYASPSYLEVHGVPKHWEELRHHTWISHSVAGMREVEHAEQGPSEQLGPQLRINDFGAIRELIRAGVGLGFLPSFSAPEDTADEGLIRVLPEICIPQGNLWLVWPEARHVAPRVRAFIDYMANDADFAQAPSP